MNKENSSPSEADRNDMRPEYDLARISGGVRGKYYRAYRRGHTVKIHQANGGTLVQHFKLEDGAVVIEPDVREHFPDSESVNRALRCLIPLLPKKRGRRARRQRDATPAR
jgi:hypothetical protein